LDLRLEKIRERDNNSKIYQKDLRTVTFQITNYRLRRKARIQTTEIALRTILLLKETV